MDAVVNEQRSKSYVPGYCHEARRYTERSVFRVKESTTKQGLPPRARFKLTEESSSLKLFDFRAWSSPSEQTVKYLTLVKLHSQVLDLPFSFKESPEVAGFQVFSSTEAKRKSSLGQVVNNLTTCFNFCQA